MTADTIEKDPLHQTSLAVWDIPTPAAGERFSIKVGAKSSAGCALGARRVEVLDGEAVVAAAHLGCAPWPGTDALFWTEVELRAPDQPGLVMLAVRFDAAELAKGRYELVVWKAGYDAPVTPLTIDADTSVQIDARVMPQPDPDAVWT